MKVIHAARFTINEEIYQQEDNVFVFDKPYQCTSFDLVAKVKYAMKRKFGKKLKVGHAGTLDPLATGVMIICTGKYTKQIDSFQAAEKEYTGTFRLGETTPSYDMEKPVDATYPTDHITEEAVRQAAADFIGEQEQIPPQSRPCASRANGHFRTPAKARMWRSSLAPSPSANLKSPVASCRRSISGLSAPKALTSVPSPATSG